jgi:hypothetical protein
VLFRRPSSVALMLFTIFGVSSCGGGGSQGAARVPKNMRSVALIPFDDPSWEARQRWLDIADQPYSGRFTNEFRYTAGQVVLSYDPDPSTPYFIGHIEARGLKPNFSYQLKLAGKPSAGNRGWGTHSDDRANEAIGRATRWWNDTTQANTNDRQFQANALLPPEQQYSIYGYAFMGEFVTDANGNASVNFNGSRAYHIVWQDKQNSFTDRLFGNFEIASSRAPFYGYGNEMPRKRVKLWYEWESGRPHDVRLPAGTYNCRFLLTEETFHAVNAEVGGKWPTVLASEDFGPDGQPDAIVENDIVFTIK